MTYSDIKNYNSPHCNFLFCNVGTLKIIWWIIVTFVVYLTCVIANNIISKKQTGEYIMQKQILSVFIGLALSGYYVSAYAADNCKDGSLAGGKTCIITQSMYNKEMRPGNDYADYYTAKGDKTSTSSDNHTIVKDISVSESAEYPKFTRFTVFNSPINDTNNTAENNTLLIENSTFKRLYGFWLFKKYM